MKSAAQWALCKKTFGRDTIEYIVLPIARWVQINNGAVFLIAASLFFWVIFPPLTQWQKSIDKYFLHGVTGFMIKPAIQSALFFMNNGNHDNGKIGCAPVKVNAVSITFHIIIWLL